MEILNTLKFSDVLNLALNKGNVCDNIALTPKANEVNTQINNWINNNIVNLIVESNIDKIAANIITK
ncbi:hypothetical protein FLA4_06660 [Candidatus Rickettsia kotlanii]|nr:hypothetical protein FLA4_06660 [Candidatus Rickettsia kotlanii]BDU61499.1 hypothetical protein HM2_06670 [Candidatus Rickettsia kotlanii]